MNGFEAAAALLPGEMAAAAKGLPPELRERAEEFRLRMEEKPTVSAGGREYVFCPRPVDGDILREVAERATESSFHAAEGQLRRGYLTAGNGVRVGVCGSAVTGKSGAEGMRELSSVSVRIPREVAGCADGIWEPLTDGGFVSTLVIGAPGAGKTTLLRELIRKLSEGGFRVSVADERGELAGMHGGHPGFALGRHTDVLTGFPKAEAVKMLLRCMSPQIIAADEITEREDGIALSEVADCGVALLASVHGDDPREVYRSGRFRSLAEAGVFRRYALVKLRDGSRVYEAGAFPCGG